METHVLLGTDVFWTALEQPGLEQLHLEENETGVVADGLVVGRKDAVPFRLWYQMQTDSRWNVRECVFQVGGAQGKTVRLRSDGRGHWTAGEGAACPALDGCLDVDLTCTPFTNTLPIRRLALAPGESAELLVAYVTVPDLSIHPVRQRYTCLSRAASGGVYRYEGLDSNFTADLPVDAQGLVIDYPELWKRAEGQAEAESFSSQPDTALEGLLASGPHPELAEKLRLFGQFVGSWDVDWTGYAPGSAAPQRAKGEIHFAWVLAGRAIQDVWIFPTREDQQRGQPVDEWGSTLRFYDPGTDTWKISWHAPVNNFTRAMTARPVGDEIWVEGANFQGQPLRWVFSQITSRSFHWTNFVSEDDGQTWRVQEELKAQRRAPQASKSR